MKGGLGHERARVALSAFSVLLILVGAFALTTGAKEGDLGPHVSAGSLKTPLLEEALNSGMATEPGSDSVPGEVENTNRAPLPGSEGQGSGERASKEDLPVELVVVPACGSPGSKMSAELKAVPGAYVSMIVAYADGQSYQTWYVGPVAEDGSLRWEWTVHPSAAEGEGRVMAAVHDPATDRSGKAWAPFQVVRIQGCPA